MSELRRVRKSVLIVGAERSGKSYFAARLARELAAGSWALIYNVVRSDDFAGAVNVEFLTFKDHELLLPDGQRRAYKSDPGIYLFRALGESKVYHARDFNKVSWGNVLKMGRFEYAQEEAFFQCCFDNMGCGLIVLDDSRATFRHGLKSKMIQLLSRKNHAGNSSTSVRTHGYGVDVALIFHAVDKVNQEIYDYINVLVLFKTLRRPEESKFTNQYLYNAINWAYDLLADAPDYHSVHMDLAADGGKIEAIHRDANLKSVAKVLF